MSIGAESGLVCQIVRDSSRSPVGRPVTVEEDRDRSVRAVTGAWCEYEAQGRDFDRSAYLPARVSYVDDDLVVAVTDLARTRFVTGFHEHFDGRQPPRLAFKEPMPVVEIVSGTILDSGSALAPYSPTS